MGKITLLQASVWQGSDVISVSKILQQAIMMSRSMLIILMWLGLKEDSWFSLEKWRSINWPCLTAHSIWLKVNIFTQMVLCVISNLLRLEKQHHNCSIVQTLTGSSIVLKLSVRCHNFRLMRIQQCSFYFKPWMEWYRLKTYWFTVKWRPQ